MDQRRDIQGPNPSEPPKRATHYDTRSRTCSTSFRSLCVFLVREILVVLVLQKQHRNVSVTETLLPQDGNCFFDLTDARVNTMYACVLAWHDDSPFFRSNNRHSQWGHRFGIIPLPAALAPAYPATVEAFWVHLHAAFLQNFNRGCWYNNGVRLVSAAEGHISASRPSESAA